MYKKELVASVFLLFLTTMVFRPIFTTNTTGQTHIISLTFYFS